MTEQQPERDSAPTPIPARRDGYTETTTNEDSLAATNGVAHGSYQQRAPVPDSEPSIQQEQVRAPSTATRRGMSVTRIKQVIYFIVGVINVLLIIRFVLLLLGANEASSFVSMLYGLSQAFVRPFSGIFAEPSLGDSVFEWATLVGIIVYSLLGYGVARIVELVYAPTRPTVTS